MASSMNLVSLLIGAGINLIYTPFPDNARSETRVLREIDGNLGKDMSIFPFNVLRNSQACSTIPFVLGESRLKLMAIPRGSCTNCCPIKLSRDIRFVLYNKAHPQTGTPIFPFDQVGAAEKAGVNPEWDTVFFIHGFSEPSPGPSGMAIINAYVNREENYNIILIDWSELATFPWYKTAVQNIKLVGRLLRRFLKLFNKSGEIPINRVHVIGFSLGCHIASIAGKRLQGKVRIPRITALDPAFPEFSLQDRTKRLASSDADYIDVIHTDSGILGFPLSIGHADFYPNGGRALQPGCQPSYLAQQRIINQVLACSHVRAWRLYAESVQNPEAFPATQCQNWRGQNKECNFTVDAFMGFASNRNAVGQFYLRTGFRSPYGLKVSQQTS